MCTSCTFKGTFCLLPKCTPKWTSAYLDVNYLCVFPKLLAIPASPDMRRVCYLYWWHMKKTNPNCCTFPKVWMGVQRVRIWKILLGSESHPWCYRPLYHINILLTLSGIHWRFTVFPQWGLLQSCPRALLVWLETSVFTARLLIAVSKNRYQFLPNALEHRWLPPNQVFRSWFSPLYTSFSFLVIQLLLYMWVH